jgi:hypothetical protein
MNGPFEAILRADRYHLGRTWGSTIDITGTIRNTYLDYGDGVLQSYFDRMMTKITQGGKYSPFIAKKVYHDIDDVCRMFSKKMNTVNVDKIIKCTDKNKRIGQSCFDTLFKYGYKFTKAQLKKLNGYGYLTLTYMESEKIGYEYLLELIGNPDFIKHLVDQTEIVGNPLIDPLIDQLIETLKKLIGKNNITLKSDFLSTLMKSMETYGNGDGCLLNRCINCHYVADKLGCPFSQDVLESVVKSCTKLKTNDAYDYEKIKILMKYYDTSFINREYILSQVDLPSVFTFLLNPCFTDYNPTDDIFFILLSSSEYIEHLLKYGYLKYDLFLMFLISLGFGKGNDTENLNMCLDLIGVTSMNELIGNFYTFADHAILELLETHKFIQSVENLKLCTKIKQLTGILETSVFLDSECVDLIDDVVKKQNNKHYFAMDLSHTDFVKIYESMGSDDRKIIERLCYEQIMDLGFLVRYNVRLTRPLVESIVCRGMWDQIIRLMHLSDRYDYLMDMMDWEMIVQIDEYIGRKWIMRNIIESRKESFAFQNKFINSMANVKEDRATLLKKPIINQIDVIKESIRNESDALIKKKMKIYYQITDQDDKPSKINDRLWKKHRDREDDSDRDDDWDDDRDRDAVLDDEVVEVIKPVVKKKCIKLGKKVVVKKAKSPVLSKKIRKLDNHSSEDSDSDSELDNSKNKKRVAKN